MGWGMKKFAGIGLIALVMFLCVFAVGCASSQPVDLELAEQNQVNAQQSADDAKDMIDLLNRAAKGDETWKKEWDDPALPDDKKSIQNSIKLQIVGWVAGAAELLKNAQRKNGVKPPDPAPAPGK